jgi:multidrug efflux system membrane fusion protein
MAISRKNLVIGGIGAVAVVAAVYFGMERGAGAPTGGPGGPKGGGFPAMPVTAVPVVKQTVPVYLNYVGTTEAVRTVTLQSKADGHLVETVAADGADVKEGDVLYRVDPRDYQAALDQANAAARRDGAARDYNKSKQSRNETLARDGWIAKDSVDQTASTLSQSNATLAADEAAIRTARLKLSYTEVKAPFSGRLSRAQVHEGALVVAENTKLNTLVQLDPIRVTFSPAERDLATFAKTRAEGAIPAEVNLPDQRDNKLAGTLTFLDNAVDRATGTIMAQVTVDNPDKRLLPGQYVQIRLKIGEQPDALLVPSAAVGSNQMGKYVYTVGEGNHVEIHVVTPGATVGNLTVIEKGLDEKAQVIVDQLQKIGPGAPIAPHPPGPPGPPPGAPGAPPAH